MRLLFLVLILLSFATIQAQEKAGIPDIEFYGGFDGGWWIYNVGSTDPNYYNTEGWERSYASPTFVLGMNLAWQIKKLRIGAGFDRAWFIEDEMIGADHSDGNRDLYDISDGNIPYWSVYGLIGFRLAESKHFSMTPNLRLGYFTIESLHPDQGNFTNKWYFQAAVDMAWEQTKWALVFRPFYRSRHMKPIDGNQNESHTIFGFGGELAWRWKW